MSIQSDTWTAQFTDETGKIRRVSTKPILCNVKITASKKHGAVLHATDGESATNGRQLAVQEFNGKCVMKHKTETAIVPLRTLQILERVLSDKSVDNDDVKMAVTDNKMVLFQYKHITLVSRLLDGQFPQWRNIVPKTEGETPAKIECGALLQAVLKAQVVTNNEEPGIDFLFAKGKLTLQGQDKGMGESNVVLPIVFHDDVAKQVRLNAKFMTDFLRVLRPERQLSIYVFDADEPVKIVADDGGYTYVVAPMAAE